MPSKSASPEAAQRKVWKAEISTHQSAAKKVLRDFKQEERRLCTEIKKAYATYLALNKQLAKFRKARAVKQPREISNIESRIAILRGRLGI